MSLSEGLESKELREALENIVDEIGDCHHGLIAKDAISHLKSSYEQEAELMEDVISAADKIPSHEHDAFMTLRAKIYRLDKFRKEMGGK